MSVVIIGGHDRMVGKYREICKEYKCHAKIFTQHTGHLEGMIGEPDLIVLFTNPVSHKMAIAARNQATRKDITLVQSHCGSGNALREILKRY